MLRAATDPARPGIEVTRIGPDLVPRRWAVLCLLCSPPPVAWGSVFVWGSVCAAVPDAWVWVHAGEGVGMGGMGMGLGGMGMGLGGMGMGVGGMGTGGLGMGTGACDHVVVGLPAPPCLPPRPPSFLPSFPHCGFFFAEV
jgi:hypothetical protein